VQEAEPLARAEGPHVHAESRGGVPNGIRIGDDSGIRQENSQINEGGDAEILPDAEANPANLPDSSSAIVSSFPISASSSSCACGEPSRLCAAYIARTIPRRSRTAWRGSWSRRVTGPSRVRRSVLASIATGGRPVPHRFSDRSSAPLASRLASPRHGRMRVRHPPPRRRSRGGRFCS
jgi:hypothetical protein